MKTLTSMKSVEGNIQGFILSIVGVAVVLAVGLIILSQLSSNVATQHAGGGCNATATNKCGAAYNATVSIQTQMATIPQWIGIIITVALAFIVLGYFYNRM
jgi:ABC-type antimicrobial peptide transport system permease subunit